MPGDARRTSRTHVLQFIIGLRNPAMDISIKDLINCKMHGIHSAEFLAREHFSVAQAARGRA